MGAELQRQVIAAWPRLMSAPIAAAYLSLSETTIREHGPKAKRYGKRVLWDINDLNRWADALGDQPLDEKQQKAEAASITEAWLRNRKNARG